jgi:hypothetical protein
MNLVLQSVERCTNHVVWVRGTGRLGNNVVDAERFENSAHWTTGDDTGTSLCRAQQNLASAVTTVNIMMQRTTIAQWYEDQIALCAFGSLADSFWNFASLAVTEANATLLVTNDDESSKTETTAALNNFGDAVDSNQLVDEFAIALFAVLAVVARTSFFLCHCPFPFSFAGGTANNNGPPASLLKS